MSSGTSAIADAVLRGDLAALVTAIVDGSDLTARDKAGRTYLTNAVIGQHPGIVEQLLRAGADVSARDKQGFTALHHAAQRQSAVIVDLLIRAGAQVDAKDAFGNTPLFRAIFASGGRGDVIRALLAAGADQHVKNSSGVSPRDLASTIANFDVVKFLDEPAK